MSSKKKGSRLNLPGRTSLTAEGFCNDYIDSKLADEIMADDISLSSESEREVDFWINYRKKLDITEQLNLDKYYIDDEVRLKIKRLLKMETSSEKEFEKNFKYCYSECIWAYDRISTLQNVIKGLNSEIKKATNSAEKATKYINTILLANQQKNKNDKMVVKIQCKQDYQHRLEKIQKAFNEEVEVIKTQSEDHRIDSQMKDNILMKLTKIVIEQEFILGTIKKYYKRKFGLTKLKSFSEYRNNLLDRIDDKQPSRIPFEPSKNESVKSYISGDKENNILLHELRTMKNLVKSSVNQTVKWQNEISRLQNIIKGKDIELSKDTTVEHRARIKQLENDLYQRGLDFKEYKRLVSQEIRVKESLQKKSSKYNRVLRNELVFAKNIIKNPKIYKQMNRSMNNSIKEFDSYKYKPTSKKPPVKKKSSKKVKSRSRCSKRSVMNYSIDLSMPAKTSFIPFVGESTSSMVRRKKLNMKLRDVFTPETSTKISKRKFNITQTSQTGWFSPGLNIPGKCEVSLEKFE
ncbi:unnamed protein product [Moneuplotes crassus]|uniref:Uncharacterized protein n=1 Tax=Euplotes crassus TaxID=5936 RepID=A0AAD1XAZ1_EUPCR|nr:unnamed protein product [Moneuplotes crassus]